jgi:hypothetical protein
MNAVVLQPAPAESRAMVSQPMSPMELVAYAVQQGKDLVMIEKLMDLQDRHEAKLAKRAFDAAVASAKSEIKPIIKNREVDFTSQKGRTNYMYEDFAQIAEHVDPILAKHGLSYRHRPVQEGSKLTITCILSHRDGHSEESSLSANNDESGNKNSIQGIGSTATYLQRYTLKLALGLAAAKDDDGRSASPPERVSQEQLETLDRELKAISATADERTGFLRYLDVEKLEELPASEFQRAMQSIKDKSKAKRRQQQQRGDAQ